MTLWYLATPYTKFPGGINEAYVAACQQHALLLQAGVTVFCPIGHTHGPAVHGGIDPTDHELWKAADAPFLRICTGLLVCKLPTWDQSRGIEHEIKEFRAAGKPIVYMEPWHVPSEVLRSSSSDAVRAWCALNAPADWDEPTP